MRDLRDRVVGMKGEAHSRFFSNGYYRIQKVFKVGPYRIGFMNANFRLGRNVFGPAVIIARHAGATASRSLIVSLDEAVDVKIILYGGKSAGPGDADRLAENVHVCVPAGPGENDGRAYAVHPDEGSEPVFFQVLHTG